MRCLAMFRWIAVLLLAGLPWGAASVHAQQRKQLFVSVTEPSGAPVTDLKPADVKVFENEVQGNTVKLEPIDWPMKLTVLVDNGAKAVEYLTNMRAGLRSFFNEIPNGVEMSLLTLAPQPRWIVRPTTDREKTIKGIDLIAPDSGYGKFWDGLAEAGTRIEKEKGEYFPVVVMVATDFGGTDPPGDRDYERLTKQIREHPVTVHFVLLTTGSLSNFGVTGSIQTNVGLGVTQLSGGRYESINSHTRFTTLLPEIGQQIARSHARQSHQYRVTYEPPPGDPREARAISVTVSSTVAVSIKLTLDGRLP